MTEVYAKKISSLAGLIVLGQCSLLRNTFVAWEVLMELLLKKFYEVGRQVVSEKE